MIKILCLSILLLGLYAGAASGQESWNQDWLGVGPIYPYGPSYSPMYYDTAYYVGWEGYPIYHPVYYPIYNTYYHPYHYPYYDNEFKHFPLGTFGMLHGGNY